MSKQNNKTKEKESFFSITGTSPIEEKAISQLLVAARLYQSMLEGVYITDINGNIQFINPSFTKILGYSEEVIGQNPRIFQSGKHDQHFYKRMWASIEQEGQWVGEVWNKRKDGSLIIQQTTITKIKDDFDRPIYYAAVITDITERKKMEQRLKDDLMLAKEVQKSALSRPIHNDRIQIEGIFLPSELLGGDMYAWYQINEHTYGIFLMDVMGKGVASSLICMSVRSLLRGVIHTHIDPARVLKELNAHVYSLFREKDEVGMSHYLTCVYAVVDTEKEEIMYASAGHPPIILIQDHRNSIELDNGTVPLGMLPSFEIETARNFYDAGKSKLVFYTDGLIENEHTRISENIESLKRILEKQQTDCLQDLMKKTIEEQRDMLQLQSYYDDVTMIVAKF